VGHLRETPIKFWSAQVVDAGGEAGTVLRADEAGVVIACGEAALCFTTLQRPGSRRMAAGEFLRGFAVNAGDRFTVGNTPAA
jgi:methionyl-tRNA formyltransferase